VPVIAATTGAVLTVIILVARTVAQLLVTAYVIVDVPAVTPLTMPVSEPTVATAVLLLLHVPPLAVSLSVTGVPVHTDVEPEIADKTGVV
jgi:hypothetical protein